MTNGLQVRSEYVELYKITNLNYFECKYVSTGKKLITFESVM